MNARPLIFCGVGFAVAAALLYSTWALQRENTALRTRPSSPPNPAPSAGAPPPIADVPAAHARLEELRTELQRETTARQAAEQKAAELAQRLPVKEGDILVSFGRVEEMGQTSANLVALFTSDLGEKLKRQSSDVSDEDVTKMEKLFSAHIQQVTELRRMEEQPEKVARYHAAVLRQVYGLDGATSQRVAAQVQAAFARLRTAELTAQHRPEAEPEAWDARRDGAIRAMAAELRPLLPANHPHLNLLPGLLSLSGGTRTVVKMGADGHGSVNVTLPLFDEPMKF